MGVFYLNYKGIPFKTPIDLLKKKQQSLTFSSDRSPVFNDGLLIETGHTESCKIPSATLTNLLDLNKFTIECEYIVTAATRVVESAYHNLFAMSSDSSTKNVIRLAIGGSSSRLRGSTSNNAGTTSNSDLTGLPSLGRHKFAIAVDGTESAVYMDGARNGSPVSNPNLPTVHSDMYLNAYPGNQLYGGGYISYFTITKGKRSNAEMLKRTNLSTKGFPVDKYTSFVAKLTNDLNTNFKLTKAKNL